MAAATSPTTSRRYDVARVCRAWELPRSSFCLCRTRAEGRYGRAVWARLRVMDGIRVARSRVLRLMREHALLSPHRARRRTGATHDGHIITAAPKLMWAPDATQVTTVRDGKVRLFGVVEH